MFIFSKQKPKVAAQAWLKDANVYQLFVGRSESACAKRHEGYVFERLCAADWKALIQRRGFDIIYLLGVLDNRSPIVVSDEMGERMDGTDLDRLPSPFAVFDHTALNPELGSAQAFAKLLSIIHSYGARVIIDFVAYHTALNHPWTSSHPEYYVKAPGSPSGFKHEFSGDVIKLNFEEPGLVAAQLEALRRLKELGVDGVRCDMAHLVPASFWSKAIQEIKKEDPSFAFIAEAYSDSVFSWKTVEELLRCGFDGMYHEFFYRNLRNVFVSRQPIDYLVGHLNFVLKYEHRSRLVNYLANHDDPLFEQCAPLQESLMTLIMFMPGTAFVYNGQLNGFTRRLKHHRLDLLPSHLSEFSSVPEWFSLLARLCREKRPLIASVEHLGGNVLRCPVYVNGQLGKLFLNLGAQTITAPPSSGKGLLHGLNSGAVMAPGQAELFL